MWLLLFCKVISSKRYENPITVNDALEEVAQTQSYVTTAVDTEIHLIQQIYAELQNNASLALDNKEKEMTYAANNSTKKLQLLAKFAKFLDLDVNDCLIDVNEVIVSIEATALKKHTDCIMAVVEEAGAFSEDTITELKTYYYITLSLASNLENCTVSSCIEKTISPLTQLTNDAMININNLSGNTLDLLYNMNRSFNQCALGHIEVGETKIDSITDAVAKCINEKVSNAN